MAGLCVCGPTPFQARLPTPLHQTPNHCRFPFLLPHTSLKQQAVVDNEELAAILDDFVDATRAAAVSENLFDGQSISFDEMMDDEFQEAVAQEITNRAIENAFSDEESRARLSAAFENDEFRDELQAQLAATFADIFSYVDGEKIIDDETLAAMLEEDAAEDSAAAAADALVEDDEADAEEVDEEEFDDEEVEDDSADADEADDEE
ncbi:hypothetical protein DFJ73DRAFT_815653 [Zopfochytrium polystomum]|nr:hypothetical protein DFJ73DRAFT_815653 [Zopfochytrium polystomum]